VALICCLQSRRDQVLGSRFSMKQYIYNWGSNNKGPIDYIRKRSLSRETEPIQTIICKFFTTLLSLDLFIISNKLRLFHVALDVSHSARSMQQTNLFLIKDNNLRRAPTPPPSLFPPFDSTCHFSPPNPLIRPPQLKP
jgi:hypothetical protein